MGICGLTVNEKLAETIIETNDCMSMGMLIALNQHQEKVIDFLYNIRPRSNYNLDQYWILFYELAPGGKEFDNYFEKSGLKFLKDKNVRFINSIEGKN